MSSLPKQRYDLELWEFLKTLPPDVPFSLKTLQAQRDQNIAEDAPEKVITDPAISHCELTIPGPGGDIILSILSLKGSTGRNRPGVYHIHGGCFIMGTRLTLVNVTFDWIKACDAVVVSVEYRLAPEHPDPAPVEDCYAGLKWMSEHASELGVNPEQIILAGFSAGGGLAAGTALLARDRKGPKVCAMCLIAPMLDDRSVTVSSQQFWKEYKILSGEDNALAWGWLLQGKTGDEVSVYAAPARAKDVKGLPQAWIDVGEVEVFRDECVAFAGKLWEAGEACELHVWKGAFHSFDFAVPGAAVSKMALEARLGWIKRILGMKNVI